ncbi:helix-turn-helix domain-containing protein [Bradyrhizobium quebecense]|uniref:Helix-turn-helix domain-containing protein n=1 Tax=Bradyrhizobium quebecense TaxID=2748629 RepID=A0A973WPD0_9BRAD
MPGWHRADIIAALHKKGLTLEGLGRSKGKARASLSAALLKPSRGCNLIIAEHVGKPLHELWPDWFDRSGKLICRKAIEPSRAASTQKVPDKLSRPRRCA